uniref:E3 ubiquitin-protein ligase n=1 Tax=Pectinophora gossypiella TaxID=13191 RepID=A0A1E1VXE5_PECGO
MESQFWGYIKCHKCRHILLDDINKIYSSEVIHSECDSYDIKKFIYLLEDNLPIWIKLKVEEEQWTKGKLHCENCGSKVGTFDFISGRKCDCGKSVLPPVHFVTSQVDRPIKI